MASRSLNRVILIGNLTRDPELKYTPTGTAVCTFGVATNRSWTTADGQTKEDTQYHRIVAWQKLAELCGKLLTKGRKIYLEGRIVYRTFVGRDGMQRTIAEIVLDDFIVFGDGKRVIQTEEVPSEESKPSEAPPIEELPPHEDEALQAPTSKSDSKLSKKSEKEENKETTEKKEIVDPNDIPF